MTDSKEEDPAKIADDQFVHGLLEFLQKDDSSTQNKRLQEVMQRIDAGSETQDLPRLLPRQRRPNWPLIASIALPAMVLISVFILARDRSAAAIIDTAIEALPELGDRRYQLVAQVDAASNQPALTGNLDIRDQQHMLMQATTDEGYRLVMGRNAEGEWIVHDPRDQSGQRIEQLGQNDGWPRWLNLRAHAVLLDSVDNLLGHLHQHYDLVHGQLDVEHDHASATETIQITGFRRSKDESAAERIDLWIDPRNHLVQRMELSWPRHDQQTHQGQHQALHGQHAQPHLMHGRPEFGARGLHTAHRLIFELIEHSSFAPNWFDPESHSK
ncbi:MAG: hypothetical protein ACYTG5_19825 [Planctomycetota bacterium]|jgi:hypothetical protein